MPDTTYFETEKSLACPGKWIVWFSKLGPRKTEGRLLANNVLEWWYDKSPGSTGSISVYHTRRQARAAIREYKRTHSGEIVVGGLH